MIDTSTEAVTKLLDGVTPGPWDSEYDDYGEEIWFGGEGCGTWTVGPCFIGGDGHDPDLARIMDADAHFIAAARDLVPALLAERDALKAERDEAIEGWHVIHPNITVQDAAKVLLTAREQGQIDVEAVKLFLKGQPVAALRAIAEGK